MKEILDEHTKKRNRLINNIKKSIAELKRMDYKIRVDNNVETMIGTTTNHVYLYDNIGEKIILQKYLFSY